MVKRISRLTAGAALRALLAIAPLALTGAPSSASAAVEPPFSAAERALILPALDDCAAGGPARLGPLDDEGLHSALVDRATIDLGQRVRPSQVDSFWAIEPARRDVAAELDAARAQGRLQGWIAGLAPTDPRYRALAAACRDYAGLVAAGGWDALPEGSTLRPGQRDPQVPPLRLRLAREGFGPATAEDPDLFDEVLADGLRRFQASRSLEVDAVLGPRTRAALNVTAEARLTQIQMNLERWRWLPRRLPDERMEVDIAGAEATYFRGGEPALAMRVVVGDPNHHTPMFASRIESIVFNPPWNVPSSIATKEILPKAARDSGYLARNGFSFVDGRLVQRPGPKNSLGVVKFDLPSPFGVYLHDTPGKSAFSRVDRALSHGCMRLEKPKELAAVLLGRQGAREETVEQAIAAAATSRVALDTSVPLYVAYWTAVVDEAGRTNFRPDVYGWDAKLAAALAAAAPDRRAAMSRGDTDCATAGD